VFLSYRAEDVSAIEGQALGHLLTIRIESRTTTALIWPVHEGADQMRAGIKTGKFASNIMGWSVAR